LAPHNRDLIPGHVVSPLPLWAIAELEQVFTAELGTSEFDTAALAGKSLPLLLYYGLCIDQPSVTVESSAQLITENNAAPLRRLLLSSIGYRFGAKDEDEDDDADPSESTAFDWRGIVWVLRRHGLDFQQIRSMT